MYIRFNDEEAHITIATGIYSTNFKVEAEALHKAATEIRNNLPRATPNVVIFTDPLFVLNNLQKLCQKDLKEVETAMVDLATHTNLTLQRGSALCRIQGDKQSDRLAKEVCQLY